MCAGAHCLIDALQILAFVFGYALGSIPFGLVLTKMAGLQDIRTIGSGNIGATNVLRTGNKGLAAATLLLDALKASFAIIIVSQWQADLGVSAALGAFIGHLYPVWLRFQGGKGVATYLGCLLALFWPAAIAFALVWLAVAAITRYSSMAALIASLVSPLVVLYFDHGAEAELFVALAILLWFKHRPNIERLLAGTEGRIGAKT